MPTAAFHPPVKVLEELQGLRVGGGGGGGGGQKEAVGGGTRGKERSEIQKGKLCGGGDGGRREDEEECRLLVAILLSNRPRNDERDNRYPSTRRVCVRTCVLAAPRR